MTAIIRVKRRNDTEPSDALVISCKRCKIENDKPEELTDTIAKFAVTVQNQVPNSLCTLTRLYQSIVNCF